MSLPQLPGSWSELSWQQLYACWQVKQRYGGNADVARAAAMLQLLGMKVERRKTPIYDLATGEPLYTVCDKDGGCWRVTPRELSQMAKSALPWFDYPYGDPGEPAVKGDKGKTVKEPRDPVRGYVSKMSDALILNQETMKVGRKVFALPQVACNNLTWQQYRSLQAIAPQLFSEGVSDSQAADLQAEFLAHTLVPRSLALLDTTNGSIRFRPHYEFVYSSTQAEGLVKFWRKHTDGTLFHICFQTYQTALTYYASTYPLLFGGDEKKNVMRDALAGEVDTINTIMKYQGYSKPEDVYAENLPLILSTLNTMTKEAKEIERQNAKIKKK